MDLIGQLAGVLGVDSGKAEGFAGSVLGTIKEYAPEGALTDLLAKAPEVSGWLAKAAPMLEGAKTQGGGMTDLLGGLLDGAGGGAGGILQGAAAIQGLTSMLEKFGISPELSAKAIPLVLDFVQSKLGDEGFKALAEKVPFLEEIASAVGGAGAPAGGLGGLLGGLGGMFK